MSAAGDQVGEAHVDIHVNSGPGEAELAAFKAKVDRDFAELDRKKAEATFGVKTAGFDKDIAEAKAKLEYFEGRRAKATIGLAKKHFDEQIAAAKAELKALGKEKATVQVDSKQLRAANKEQRLLSEARRLDERVALAQAKADRTAAKERSRATTETIRSRSEIAKLSAQYEKLRGKQVALEKSSRKVFSAGSITRAEKEARKLERVASEAEFVKHKIEQLGGSVEHLDPAIARNTSMLDRWLSRLGDTSIRIGPITTSLKGLGTGLGLLGPLVFELGGGLVSLVGTIGEGLAGASAVGIGALGGLATSALGVGMVIKPMISEFSEVKKASIALGKAQLKYGKDSTQAKTAQEQLNHELHGVSPIAKEAFESYGKLGSKWRDLTKSARPAVFNAMGQSIKTAQELLPGFARESTKTTEVASKAWSGWMKSLRSSEAKQLLGNVMSDFRASIPGLSAGLASLGAMLGRIGAAGAHFLPGLSNGFAEWADNLENAVGSGDKLEHSVGSLVGQMQNFGHMTQSTGSFLVHFFDASADSGDGLVKSLDHVMQRWDKWTQTASGKASLKDFFSESQTATEDFMSSLSHFAELLFQFSRATAPLANGLLKVITFIGDIVSAADSLVGVKEIFQGIGVILGGLFVTSKVVAYADSIAALVARLGLMGAAGTAAAAGEAEVAAGAAAATAALEAEAIAAAEVDVALGAGGIAGGAEAAAGGLAAVEGAGAGAAGATAGVGMATLALAAALPLAVAGLGAYKIATSDMSGAVKELDEESAALGNRLKNAFGNQGREDKQLVSARKRESDATKGLAEAEDHLQSVRKKFGAGSPRAIKAEQELAKASDRATDAWSKQLETTEKLSRHRDALRKTARDEVIRAKAAVAVAKGTDAEASAFARLRAAQAQAEATNNRLSLASVNLKRIQGGLTPLTYKLADSFARLKENVGAAATKKIGQFVKPEDVKQVTNLGNRLSNLGRGAQVKNIAVKSKGADETIGKLQRLQRQSARVDGKVTNLKVNAKDSGAKQSLTNLARLSQRLNGTKNTVHILANSQNAEQAIERLRGRLQQVAHQKYQAVLTAADRTNGPRDAAYHKAREFASQKYQAVMSAVDRASAPAKGAKGAADKFKGNYSANLQLNGSQAAISQANAARSAAEAFKGTTVHQLITEYKTKGSPPGRATGGPAAYVPPGPSPAAMQRAADNAVYVPSGPSRKVNKPTMLTGEEPAHPEYVIATNPAYRESNERYLESAANHLGYEVVPAYAAGKGAKKPPPKGKKGAGSSSAPAKKGPGPHPPPINPKRHHYIPADALVYSKRFNQLEKDAEIEEGHYGAELNHEEREIEAGRMDNWNYALLRKYKTAVQHDYQTIKNPVLPEVVKQINDQKTAATQSVQGIRKELSHVGGTLGGLEHDYSAMEKNKNESTKDFNAKKRAKKYTINEWKKRQKKLKEERDAALKIIKEAKEELHELKTETEPNLKDSLQEVGGDLQYLTDVETGVVEAPYAESGPNGDTPVDIARAKLLNDEIAGADQQTLASDKQSLIAAAETMHNQALSTPGVEDDIATAEELKSVREEAKNGAGGAPTIGEQTSTFNEARQSLYQQFASNITGAAPAALVGQIMAMSGGNGATAQGAAVAGNPPMFNTMPSAATPAGGSGKVTNVTNNFAAPPPDPHTWTKQQKFELGTL